MSNKKFFMVLDTETFGAKKVFDLGYSVIDRDGKVYEQGSFIVHDFFEDEDSIREFIHDEFCAKNAQIYLSALANGNEEFKICNFKDIRSEVNEVLKRYDATVCAYNVAFDLRALDKTTALLLCEPNFFTQDIKVIDIWAAALSTMCVTLPYLKFVTDNGLYTDKGNPKTSAESVYRFISDNPDFEELHMGYADVLIECAILVKCLKSHKKVDRDPVGFIIHNPSYKVMTQRFHTYF